MIEIYDFIKGSAVEIPAEPLSLALGNFDGVHLGHRALLDEAVKAASDTGCAGAVLTFDRNPSGAPALTPTVEKLRLFKKSGLRYAVICPFDGVRHLTAEQFVCDILVGRLGTRIAVCGFNHRFGHRGAGEPELLSRLMEAHGGSCRTVAPVLYGGEPISSSRIRTALAEGNIDDANAMLGRPYSIATEVVHGRALGRKLGFPTINQRFEAGQALPKRGVYSCRCLDMPAVCNVGVRPTVEDSDEVVCETHIIGYEGDLYGKKLRVHFLKFLRGEQRFDSLEALSAQLEKDIAAVSDCELND